MYEYEISVHVIPDYDITATDVSEIEMEVESGQLYPNYSGPYSVDAAMYDQTLPTQYKNMTGDIVVNAVEEVNGVVTLPTADGEAKYIDITDKSGSIISQYHAKEDYSVGITPIQTGTGDPYPAGGGKNKLPSGKLQYTATQVRIGIDESNNWYHHLDAGTYTLSYTTNVTVTAYYTKSGGSAVNVSNNGGTFTLSEAGDYGFHLYKQGGISVNDVLTFQLEAGSSATPYAPYSNIRPISGWTGANIYVSPTLDQADATVYNIDWTDEAGTVYGGTLDVTLGKLRVTHKKYKISDATITWSYSNGRFRTNSLNSEMIQPAAGQTDGQALCDSYKIVNTTVLATFDATDMSIIIGSDISSYKVLIRDSRYTDTTSWKAAMGDSEIVFTLAVPLEYTLSATEIQLLMGANNIWADCGDVTVTWGVQ